MLDRLQRRSQKYVASNGGCWTVGLGAAFGEFAKFGTSTRSLTDPFIFVLYSMSLFVPILVMVWPMAWYIIKRIIYGFSSGLPHVLQGDRDGG
jgi:hypothetical protein